MDDKDTFPACLQPLFLNGKNDMAPFFSQSSLQYLDCFRSVSDRKTNDWVDEYLKKVDSPVYYHDEPWLTLVSLFGLLNKNNNVSDSRRVEAINALLGDVYLRKAGTSVLDNSPHFESVTGGYVEVYLPENLVFRKYLREKVFGNIPFHHYADRRTVLTDKLGRDSASLEGNTNLDALISGFRAGGNCVHIFCEVKFLSDISKDIQYLTARNQIVRNIDAAIFLLTEGGENLAGLDDFWFVLLTPGLFRTEKYGGPVSTPLDSFLPWKSRFYCYKMDDYTKHDALKEELPQWVGILEDHHWEKLSGRIGWLTFEEIVQCVVENGFLDDIQRKAFLEFFKERMIEYISTTK